MSERIFEQHGRLSVNGTKLMDENGNEIRLCGMSAYWLHPFRHLLQRESLITLRDEWKTNCLRLPISTWHYKDDNNGEGQIALLKEVVETATDLGFYVIIDWHVLGEQNPLKTMDIAVDFFEKVTAYYGDAVNILYEICNEPNREGTWDCICEYANTIIPIIRKNAPKSVIMVGTPTWSQDVDVAADAPLGYENLMYSLHFYASTHKDDIRAKAIYAHEKGLPLFVNEFGLCTASGNGEIDVNEAEAWKKLMDDFNISFICWNLSTVNESASVLKHECTSVSHWTDDEISVQGHIVRKWFIYLSKS